MDDEPQPPSEAPGHRAPAAGTAPKRATGCGGWHSEGTAEAASSITEEGRRRVAQSLGVSGSVVLRSLRCRPSDMFMEGGTVWLRSLGAAQLSFQDFASLCAFFHFHGSGSECKDLHYVRLEPVWRRVTCLQQLFSTQTRHIL